MRVLILAGGLGTRLAEETNRIPKPMVEIGGRPILWHIMKIYAHHGFCEFAVALGYKGEIVKRYFVEYHQLKRDLSVSLASGRVEAAGSAPEDWTIYLVGTGQQSQTAGRIKRLQTLVGDETFMVTYGDGVGDVDIRALVAFHKAQGRVATVTAVRPPARFGGLVFDGDLVSRFTEKPQAGEGWINGGFLVFEPALFDHIEGDATSLESDVLEKLAAMGELAAYRHDGFWQCMDHLRDVRLLNGLWASGSAPWKIWES